MKHKFYQVDPNIISMMNNMQMIDYVHSHEDTLSKLSIRDRIVLRNIDIDSNNTNLFYLGRGEKRFFSSISDYRDEDMQGLNYHGITIINTETLNMIANSHVAIYLFDMYAISRLKNFFEKAYVRGLWIVHFGI